MTWPFEERVAYYDAWVAASALVVLAGVGLALELARWDEARAYGHRIAATMSSAEPPPGPDARAVAEVEALARVRLREAADRLRRVARRLARSEASPLPSDDAAAPIRQRVQVDALRASLGGGSLALSPEPEALALAQCVVQRLGDAGLGPRCIRALGVHAAPATTSVDPIATRTARTRITLDLAVHPRLLAAALQHLRDDSPRLLLERLGVQGDGADTLRVHLELTQLEVVLGGEPALPRAHRDPEEGWLLDDPPAGGRW